MRRKTSNAKTAHHLDEAPRSAPVLEQIAGGDKKRHRLVTQNRTRALTEDSRRKFAVYWWLTIKWGSAVMSRILLGAVKHRLKLLGT